MGLLLVMGRLSAQKGSQSPYSSYGLGEINYEDYAVFNSMGGVSLGSTDSAIVNANNPASYTYIARHKPILQVGMNGRFSEFSTSESSANRSHFGLNQFQLGVPIKKRWGAALGVKPYSFTGYTITNYTVADEDTTQQQVYEGSGGVRIANFGLGFRMVNNSHKDTVFTIVKSKEFNGTDSVTVKKRIPLSIGERVNRVSIGASANYMFGTSKKIRSTEFIPSTGSKFNARVEDGLRVSGLTYDIGLNYQFGFVSSSQISMFSVGLTYSPESEVRAYQDLFSYSYLGSFYRGEQVIVGDTIEYINDNQGLIVKPESYKIGFQYNFKPKSSSSQLRIGADLTMERWSSYYSEFSGIQSPNLMRDRMGVGVGLEWIPVTGTSVLETDVSYLAKMSYRVGLNYAQTELQVQNNLGEQVGIDNYGMSFGLGLPIRVDNSNTSLNFGANFGNLGTTDNGLIRERYIGVYFGISITPGKSNLWFVKRKYN